SASAIFGATDSPRGAQTSAVQGSPSRRVSETAMMSAPEALMAATVSSTGLPSLPPPPQMLKAMTVSVSAASAGWAMAAIRLTVAASNPTFILDPQERRARHDSVNKCGAWQCEYTGRCLRNLRGDRTLRHTLRPCVWVLER